MRSIPQDEAIYWAASTSAEALTALRNLASHAPLRPQLLAAGVPAATCAAMRKQLARKGGDVQYPEYQALVYDSACATLRNLAASPEGRAAVAAAGACDVAVAAMRFVRRADLRSDTAEVGATWAACGLLTSLAFEPATCAALLRADAAGTSVTAMRKFPQDSRIGWAVAGLLLKLAQWEASTVEAGDRPPRGAGAGAEGAAAAVGGAGSRADRAGAGADHLPLLEEGVGEALALHGATDVRVARAAVAAAQRLRRVRAARGEDLPEAVMDALRATAAAHEAAAASGKKRAAAADRHAAVAALCRSVLSP